jgi:hypothetical protein
MAIVFDSGSGTNFNAASASYTHIVADQPNKFLIVGVTIRTTTSSGTGVSYGGQQLTRLDSVTNSTNVRNEIWYLAMPPTGSNTLSVSLNSSSKTSVESTSYYGVDTSSPWGASGTQSTSSTAAAVSVTTTTANSYVYNHVAGRTNIGITFTATSPNTKRADFATDGGAAASNAHGVANDLSTTTAGLYIASGTWSTSIAFHNWGVELKPFTAKPSACGYIIKPFK